MKYESAMESLADEETGSEPAAEPAAEDPQAILAELRAALERLEAAVG